MINFLTYLRGNPYPGRGIVVGHDRVYYFLMGRSENSRNRVLEQTTDGIRIRAYDESRVTDPSLSIYYPVRKTARGLIVTNGDQTDTVYAGLAAGKSFSEALESRRFEPDAPNLTPRISGVLTLDPERPRYEMSILKSIDAAGSDCARYTFSYPAKPGLGHFIHTYVCDGNPIPTFQGEPERVSLGGDVDAFTKELWESLDADNKISLYVRFTDLRTGEITERLINKNN